MSEELLTQRFPMNTSKPAAIVTRETWRWSTLYKITLIDRTVRTVRTFTHVQDASDWLELHLPGALVEWHLQ